jgi:hypothetical protein
MNQDIYNTAINNGYIYIPGYCFQSKINYNIENKASIIRNWDYTILNDVFVNTGKTENKLDKTIAIQYYGKTSENKYKVSFFRQFWLEDIKYISSLDTVSKSFFGVDSGIFVRIPKSIKTIISTPESPNFYDWINTGTNPIVFDTSNYNTLNNVQFIMVLGGYFVKSWFTDSLTRLQTFPTDFGTNIQNDTSNVTTNTSLYTTLNGSLIFQLEKQNSTNNDKNFALKAYQNGKWNYITCNYYGTNYICGFTSTPEYRTITLLNDTNNKYTGFDWGGLRIKQDWSDYNVCAQNISSWYKTPNYKIIQPNYDYVFSKLPTIPIPPIINSVSSSTNSININFTPQNDIGSQITGYNINSYHDDGCSYRNISLNDSNLKTNTDGTLTYIYPSLTSRKSYNGSLTSLPINCTKEPYEFIPYRSLISYSKSNNIKSKENYIFTLSALNNVGESSISNTNNDVLPNIPTPDSPSGSNIPSESFIPNSPSFSYGIFYNNDGTSLMVINIKPPITTNTFVSRYTITISPSIYSMQKIDIDVLPSNNVKNISRDKPNTIVSSSRKIQQGDRTLHFDDKNIIPIQIYNVPNATYNISITASNIYGVSNSTSQSIVVNSPNLQPTPPEKTQTSKYAIIGIGVIVLLLLIVLGIFLLKKKD